MARLVGCKRKLACLGAISTVLVLQELEDTDDEPQKKKRQHRFWQRAWLAARNREDQANTVYKLQQELLALGDVDEFRLILRMPPDVYSWLLETIRPAISKQDTNYRKAITAEERLAITMRHLALGDCPLSLSGQFRVGISTTGKIIRETCKAIYDRLKDMYLVTPSTEEEWIKISDAFATTWNMPHCIGAVDGKHFRITRPPSSGSFFYNYKHYYSLVLMAVVDAEYNFMFLDVGAEGKASDGGIWAKSAFRSKMNDAQNPLNLPQPRPLPGTDESAPYFVVGDDAFPLQCNLMKPYPNLNLTTRQRVYNYRLSRCRRVVENAFGILTTKFRLFRQEMSMRPEGCQVIIAAAVVLHNMLRARCGKHYMPRGALDQEDASHNVVEGIWRQEEHADRLERSHLRNPRYQAKEMRDCLANYFVGAGEVYWQYSKI